MKNAYREIIGFIAIWTVGTTAVFSLIAFLYLLVYLLLP